MLQFIVRRLIVAVLVAGGVLTELCQPDQENTGSHA